MKKRETNTVPTRIPKTSKALARYHSVFPDKDSFKYKFTQHHVAWDFPLASTSAVDAEARVSVTMVAVAGVGVTIE